LQPSICQHEYGNELSVIAHDLLYLLRLNFLDTFYEYLACFLGEALKAPKRKFDRPKGSDIGNPVQTSMVDKKGKKTWSVRGKLVEVEYLLLRRFSQDEVRVFQIRPGGVKSPPGVYVLKD
jgi:hypothetical protein